MPAIKLLKPCGSLEWWGVSTKALESYRIYGVPQTYQEIFDSYKRVWALLLGKIGIMQDDERRRTLDILIQRSYGIGIIPSLVDLVINTLRQLVRDSYLDQQEIIPLILNITKYDKDKINPEVWQVWENFKKEVIKDDFQSQMRRYVMLSFLEDVVNADGNFIDVAQKKIKSLAEQVIDQPELLFPELSWLVTAKAEGGFQFGFELGTLDKGFSFLPTIIQAQKETGSGNNRLFLAGYFKAIFDCNQELWEDLLDKFAVDEITVNWIPELTWRSGISDRAATRLLKLAQTGKIPIYNFRLFAFGNVIKNLSKERFLEWMSFLIGSDDESSVAVILCLYYQFFVGNSGQKLPDDFTFQVLANPFLEDKANIKFHTMDVHYWQELSKAYIEQYPEKMLDLAALIIENFRDVDSPTGNLFPRSDNVLDLIAKQKPSEVWRIVEKFIGPPIDHRANHLKVWLNGGIWVDQQKISGALEYFKLEDIFQWVDANIEKRAEYISSMAPKRIFRDSEKPCIAREILVRYGKRKDVKKNLYANFMTEGWTGPASIHFENKKNMLLEYKTKEDNENVLSWIDEFVISLNQKIKFEKMREEREGF